jgi:hypothetical protein
MSPMTDADDLNDQATLDARITAWILAQADDPTSIQYLGAVRCVEKFGLSGEGVSAAGESGTYSDPILARDKPDR